MDQLIIGKIEVLRAEGTLIPGGFMGDKFWHILNNIVALSGISFWIMELMTLTSVF